MLLTCWWTNIAGYSMYFRKILILIIGIILSGFIVTIHASNLVDVYLDAVQFDPTFKQAEYNWMSAKEALPIARSDYLPQIVITGDAYRSYQEFEPVIQTESVNGYYNNYGYTVTLTQALFNAAAWFSIKQAKASVKAATGTYLAAAQDLMFRTASAYFAVLQAYDKLRYTIANKEAVWQQLDQSEQKFKVGLIAITAVYEAQSAYDQAIATEISDRNLLNDRLEDLRAITGQRYCKLAGLKESAPLVRPQPNNIEAWVQVASLQNYSIQAQSYAVIAARENIRQQASGNLPVINAQSSYSRQVQSDVTTPTPPSTFTSIEANIIGVTANFPIFQGGRVIAQTDKARYDYLSASSKREFVYRDTVNKTRQSFLGIISGVSQIQADKQAIASAHNAFLATKAGYDVGTRTMVDVLNDLSALYQVEQKYADDQYNYIVSTIELKQAAGVLGVDDLQKINRWLPKEINVYGAASAKTPVIAKNPTIESVSTIISKTTNPNITSNQGGEIEPEATTEPLTKAPLAPEPEPLTTTPLNSTHSIQKSPTTKSPTTKSLEQTQTQPSTTLTPANYTIQIIASHSEQDAQQFIKKITQDKANLAIDPTLPSKLKVLQMNGWYKVVYGQYNTSNLAQKSIQTLPPDLKKFHPWILKY